ncbi:MAG: hypothetical protein AAF558_09925, partial [Verrucomicrobiota bacterium]
MSKKEILILGDQITDVAFSEEARLPIAYAKENLAQPLSDGFTVSGRGGVSYLDSILKLLFLSHWSPSKDRELSHKNINWNDLECKEYKNRVISPHAKAGSIDFAGSINHWTIGERPKSLTKKGSANSVFRAIERTGKQIEEKRKIEIEENIPESFDPNLVLISDYNRRIRNSKDWSKPRAKELLTSGAVTENGELFPRRIILLGNKLPDFCRKSFGTGDSREIMWDLLRRAEKSLQNTVVVTSLDRLRREGANISKRQSWDDTLLSFQQALHEFLPLANLARFGHLVVRAGLVGAFYVRRIDSETIRTRFFYDPNADQVVFRDRALQGTSFA